MHFRFRCKLLTLLILTALIAGGIKFWRGPHRMVMSYSPTAEEQLLFVHFAFSGMLHCNIQPVFNKYEYIA